MKDNNQIKKEKILQAKEKFIELKSNHDQLINKKNQEIIRKKFLIKKDFYINHINSKINSKK